MATRRKNGDDIPHLTLLVLHEIRDTLRDHGERLTALEQATIDGFTRVREAIDRVSDRVDNVSGRIDHLTLRFEHMNETIGAVVRDQGRKLAELDVRLTRVESRLPP
jgi:methyl-accepting chemotaxis protein